MARQVLADLADVRIDAEDLLILGGRSAEGGRSWRHELPAEGISLRDVERELVIEALERTGYVQKDAAKLIGVSRRKLNYMIQRMGITHPAWRRNRDAESAADQTAQRVPPDTDTP